MSIRSRINNEMKLFKGNNHSNLFFHSSKDNPALIDVMMIGTPGTVYGGGFFYFKVDCNLPYPYRNPKVKMIIENIDWNTLHPNFYPDGQICLSILGTDKNFENEWTAFWTIEKIFLGLFGFLNDGWIDLEELTSQEKEDWKVIMRFLVYKNNKFIMDKIPSSFKEKILEYKENNPFIFEENLEILKKNSGRKIRNKYGEYLIYL